MNYKEWSKRKFILFVAIVLVFGMWLAPRQEGKVVEVEKVVEVQKEADLTDWKALKSTDDTLLSACGDALDYSSRGIFAIIDGDSAEINAMTEKIVEVTEVLESEMTTRSEIVKRLGY